MNYKIKRWVNADSMAYAVIAFAWIYFGTHFALWKGWL